MVPMLRTATSKKKKKALWTHRAMAGHTRGTALHRTSPADRSAAFRRMHCDAPLERAAAASASRGAYRVTLDTHRRPHTQGRAGKCSGCARAATSSRPDTTRRAELHRPYEGDLEAVGCEGERDDRNARLTIAASPPSVITKSRFLRPATAEAASRHCSSNCTEYVSSHCS